MTAADVNVPELVARALREPDYIGCSCCAQSEGLDYSRDDPRAEGVARLALAALRSPDVEAGIARVLRDADDEWRRLLADAPQGHPPTRSQWQARAVVEWITGGEG